MQGDTSKVLFGNEITESKDTPYSAIEILKQMHLKHQQERFPNFPKFAIPRPNYNDATANGLTNCIIHFIRLSGGMAERISSEGRIIDQRKAVTDYLGRTKVIGSIKRVYASTTKGTADISSIIQGKSVKIEIKIKKDKMSDYQKAYQDQVIKAGGIYLVVKDFASFYRWYILKFGE